MCETKYLPAAEGTPCGEAMVNCVTTTMTSKIFSCFKCSLNFKFYQLLSFSHLLYLSHVVLILASKEFPYNFI